MEEKQTQSQTVKQICDLLEAFGLPQTAVEKVKKLCWYLADSEPQAGKGRGNGYDRTKQYNNKE